MARYSEKRFIIIDHFAWILDPVYIGGCNSKVMAIYFYDVNQ